MMIVITSGRSSVIQHRIAAAHGLFSRIRQVAPMCTPSNTWLIGPTHRLRVHGYRFKIRKNSRILPLYLQETQLSPSDRAMRLVSSNLANCHATVQKLLI